MNELSPEHQLVSLQSLWRTLPRFERRLSDFLAEMKIDPFTRATIDHAGVRLATAAQAHHLINEVSPISVGGTWFSRKLINGRDVYIFQLLEPFKILNQSISFLEIPYPKEGRQYDQVGWEHIEFTLRPTLIKNRALHALPEKEALAAYQRDFAVAFPTFFAPMGIVQSADSRHAEGEKYLNLLLNFEKSPDLIIRFHPRTIEEVVLGKCE